MKLQQLEYFMAVSKYASFTLASQKLHTSQPYLSTQLKELERELGASLILRDKKHCRLFSSRRSRRQANRNDFCTH